MTSASSAPSAPAPMSSVQASNSLVRREQHAGLVLTQTGTPKSCEFDLTLTPLPHEDLEAMLQRLKCVLLQHKAVPVLQFVFGGIPHIAAGHQLMQRVFGEVTWPVTWSEGTGIPSGGLAGVQVFAVSARPIESVRQDGKVTACLFDNGPSRHCLVGGLGYARPGDSRPEQTRKALSDLESILGLHGFGFGDIVRTWFYLEDILSWYGDFNTVRTSFYNRHAFRVGSLPASTGISARNPWGSALSAAAWASRPLNGSVSVREILSPLQCPAPQYGSSFSRAVEIDLPEGRRLLVSGTASIEPGGNTVWHGDITRQIELTMQVIDAILKSRGMSFHDITRSTAYFKRPEYSETFANWCRSSGNKFASAVSMHCDICRDDLLFELELDAIKAG